jgi:hypothetical protein
VTTIRVSPDGVRVVVDAGDHASHVLRETAAWTAGHGVTAAPLALLSGHGLAAPALAARLEALAARAGHEGGLFGDLALHAADAAARLISSQVFSLTRTGAWADLAHGLEEGGWALGRVGRYLGTGTLAEHAAHWRFGGTIDYRLTGLAGAVFGLVGAQFPESSIYGHLLDEYGRLAVGVNEAVHFVPDAVGLGLKGAAGALRAGLPAIGAGVRAAPTLAKVGGVLGVAAVAWETYHLATDDLHDLIHGDERGHSAGQRAVLYGGKVVETAGSLALSIAPFTGPAAPVVAAVGGAMLAGGALARGAVFASDWVHDHHAEIDATAAAVAHTASSVWHAVPRPHLPRAAWSL